MRPKIPSAKECNFPTGNPLEKNNLGLPSFSREIEQAERSRILQDFQVILQNFEKILQDFLAILQDLRKFYRILRNFFSGF